MIMMMNTGFRQTSSRKGVVESVPKRQQRCHRSLILVCIVLCVSISSSSASLKGEGINKSDRRGRQRLLVEADVDGKKGDDSNPKKNSPKVKEEKKGKEETEENLVKNEAESSPSPPTDPPVSAPKEEAVKSQPGDNDEPAEKIKTESNEQKPPVIDDPPPVPPPSPPPDLPSDEKKTADPPTKPPAEKPKEPAPPTPTPEKPKEPAPPTPTPEKPKEPAPPTPTPEKPKEPTPPTPVEKPKEPTTPPVENPKEPVPATSVDKPKEPTKPPEKPVTAPPTVKEPTPPGPTPHDEKENNGFFMLAFGVAVVFGVGFFALRSKLLGGVGSSSHVRRYTHPSHGTYQGLSSTPVDDDEEWGWGEGSSNKATNSSLELTTTSGRSTLYHRSTSPGYQNVADHSKPKSNSSLEMTATPGRTTLHHRSNSPSSTSNPNVGDSSKPRGMNVKKMGMKNPLHSPIPAAVVAAPVRKIAPTAAPASLTTSRPKPDKPIVKKLPPQDEEDDFFTQMGFNAKPSFKSSNLSAPSSGNADWDDDGDLDDLLDD